MKKISSQQILFHPLNQFTATCSFKVGPQMRVGGSPMAAVAWSGPDKISSSVVFTVNITLHPLINISHNITSLSQSVSGGKIRTSIKENDVWRRENEDMKSSPCGTRGHHSGGERIWSPRLALLLRDRKLVINNYLLRSHSVNCSQHHHYPGEAVHSWTEVITKI